MVGEGCVDETVKRHPVLGATTRDRTLICALAKNDSLNHFCRRFFARLEPWHTRLQIPHSTLYGYRKSRASDDTLLFYGVE